MTITEQNGQFYAYMGRRIKERRKLLSLSQMELAELMGVSYQQIQKYEAGASHLSVGKLVLFSRILNVPPHYFYEGFDMDALRNERTEQGIIRRKQGEPLRILLVDDNPADILLFKKVLADSSEKVDLDVIHDPESVMDFLQNHEFKFARRQPDLVLLDLSMPKITGIELLKSIKKNPKTIKLPVVILTNSINIQDMMEAYRNGAAGFVQKLVDVKEYLKSLQLVVRYWSEAVALPCVH